MVMAKKSAYEESRQKRLEENKRRMEELNLNKLSLALRTPKASPMKVVKPKAPKQPLDLSAVRRSSRVAHMPIPSYKEVPIEPMGRRSYTYKRRDLSNRVYASDEDRAYATQRAEDLQSGLDENTPSFVKPMLQSHVTGGFWLIFNTNSIRTLLVKHVSKEHLKENAKKGIMTKYAESFTKSKRDLALKQGLPLHFCKRHLPRRDVTIDLVDDNDEVSETKFLALKPGLSGGWRGFAMSHDLVDGDALVFQLIEPTTFKVYIIRVNEQEDSSN